MLYIGLLIILDGQNMKKTVSEICIFEVLRLESCISRFCHRPLRAIPPASKNSNSVTPYPEGLKNALYRLYDL